MYGGYSRFRRMESTIGRLSVRQQIVVGDVPHEPRGDDLLDQLGCVHLVTCGYFRSRDKDGVHTIRSAIDVNPLLHANFMTLRFIEPELLPIEVLHYWKGIFARVTLTLTRWPSCTTLICIPWRYTRCQIWTSYVKENFRKLSSDRQRDRYDQNYIPNSTFLVFRWNWKDGEKVG